MTDFTLRLPENTANYQLVITPDTTACKSLLIQEAIGALVLYDDPDLRVDGAHMLDAVAGSTVDGIKSMLGAFIPIAAHLKSILNAEEAQVEDVSFSIEVEDTAFRLTINIKPISEDTETAVLYTNG